MSGCYNEPQKDNNQTREDSMQTIDAVIASRIEEENQIKKNLLLRYLRATQLYGPLAAPITVKLCHDLLGINNISDSIAQLRKAGYRVVVNDRGEINLLE